MKFNGKISKRDVKKHKLTLFYKMKSNLCPKYLFSLVPHLSKIDHVTSLETQTILIQLMPEQPFITILFYLPLLGLGMISQKQRHKLNL